MVKKILIAVIVILFLFLCTGVVWYFFFANKNVENNDPLADSGEERVFFPTSPPAVDGPAGTSTNGSLDAPIPDTPVILTDVPTLRQLSNRPTAGFVVFTRDVDNVPTDNASTTENRDIDDDGEEIVYRFVDRATGHVYEATDSNLSVERLSNTTIPRVQEAFGNSDGETFVFRYQNATTGAIETFVGQLVEPNEEASQTFLLGEDTDAQFVIEGEYLPTNITTFTYGPDDEFVYVAEYDGDVINGLTHAMKSTFGSLGQSIFSSPLSEWIVDWAGDDLVTVTSRADSRITGISYFVNPNTGSKQRILSDIKGLTTKASPDGTYILYSESVGRRFDTYVLNTETDTRQGMVLPTLPEKCAWSTVNKTTLYCAIPRQIPSAQYPEDWYKGNLFFADTLWRIDVDIQSYVEILEADEMPSSFDIQNIAVNEGDDFLTFINRRDLTLWTLEL